MSAPSHYESLGLRPTATRDEIREAYERLSSILDADSLAVYALVDPGERNEELSRIREAHRVLADPTSRRRYDEENGYALDEVELGDADIVSTRPLPAQRTGASAHGVPAGASAQGATHDASDHGVPSGASADATSHDESAGASALGSMAGAPAHVTPMGDSAHGVPTDAPATRAAAQDAKAASSLGLTIQAQVSPPSTSEAEAPGADAGDEPLRGESTDLLLKVSDHGSSEPHPERVGEAADGGTEPVVGGVDSPAETTSSEPSVPEVDENTEFTGALLRALREARGLSLKDISGRTRIGTNHLHNIEEEAYDLLPERVFLRGFLLSVARELKLDAKRVADTYLLRRGA